MSLKNTNNLLLIALVVFVLAVSFITYFGQGSHIYGVGSFSNILGLSNETDVVGPIDIQNNTLTNYVNSLYDSQVVSIEAKYDSGSISLEERNKQLNAVLKNRDLTVSTINRLSTTKKDFLTGNITKQDILTKINSIDDLDSDLKSELNATLNGY
jgi:hypothetical protein